MLGASLLAGCPKPPPHGYSSSVQEPGLGTLACCFEIEETNPIGPGAKDGKIIAPMVGIAVDEGLVITGFSLEKLPEQGLLSWLIGPGRSLHNIQRRR